MLNQIIIMGRLTDEPKMRSTQSGISVCSFTIACDRDQQVEGGQKADFIDCVAWRKTGEFVNRYFCKGKPILVNGRLQMRKWQDKEGKTRVSAEILVNNADFCGGNKFDRNSAVVSPEVQDVPDMGKVDLTEIVGDIELPFEDHDLP